MIAIADRWPDTEVTVIAVDMPVANQPVRGRRPCDDAISSAFGAAWAGTHSPRENLPGAVSDDLIGELERLDYWLATCVPDQVDYEVRDRATIEVYPHPAIVRLLKLEVRLKYKFDKSNRFWPGSKFGSASGKDIRKLAQVAHWTDDTNNRDPGRLHTD